MKLCECGCGQAAPIAKQTITARAQVKGQPLRFRHGHSLALARATGGRRPIDPLTRLMSKLVWNGDADECWEFCGGRDGRGYGMLTMKLGEGRFQPVKAHRVAYEMLVGPIPAGKYVLHTCDNPPCCNPAHLRAGTASENALEAIARGRWKPGRTESVKGKEARRLRALGWGYKRIARELGVSRDLARSYVDLPRRRRLDEQRRARLKGG